MHTLKVLVPSALDARDPRGALLGRLEAALPILPALRLRPRSGPLGLLVGEAPVDLDAHVTLRTIHGARGVVERAIGDSARDRPPRDRPLRELMAPSDPRTASRAPLLEDPPRGCDGRAASTC
ncbi:MAG: hypothetical protein M5U28_46525 [Sandaracinaceae bacterium]|nr:hypothetical protein [Sandaracinaceae bacterium]